MYILKVSCSYQHRQPTYSQNANALTAGVNFFNTRIRIDCAAILCFLVYAQWQHLHSIWVFPKIGVPQNGWFIMENPIKMDDLEGFPIFLETAISYHSYGSWIPWFIWINDNTLLTSSDPFREDYPDLNLPTSSLEGQEFP